MAAEEQGHEQRNRSAIGVVRERSPRTQGSAFTWPKAFAIAAIWGAVLGIAFFRGMDFYTASVAMFATIATYWIS